MTALNQYNLRLKTTVDGVCPYCGCNIPVDAIHLCPASSIAKRGDSDDRVLLSRIVILESQIADHLTTITRLEQRIESLSRRVASVEERGQYDE